MIYFHCQNDYFQCHFTWNDTLLAISWINCWCEKSFQAQKNYYIICNLLFVFLQYSNILWVTPWNVKSHPWVSNFCINTSRRRHEGKHVRTRAWRFKRVTCYADSLKSIEVSAIQRWPFARYTELEPKIYRLISIYAWRSPRSAVSTPRRIDR